MKVFLKYMFWLLSFLMLTVYYLLSTQLGHKTMGYFLGEYLTKKTYNKIDVESFDLSRYPNLVIDMKVNNETKVQLMGKANVHEVDMDYQLKGEKYRWNNFLIDSPIDVQGHIKGLASNLVVNGKGEVFDGNVTYSFIKVPNEFMNMKIALHDVESQKVLKFLKRRPLLRGRVNIISEFEIFSKYKKIGKSRVFMQKGFLPTFAPYVPFVLNSKIDFENVSYKFNGDIQSDIGNLVVNNAYYHKSQNIGGCDYDLKIKELSYFEEFLKGNYSGELNTEGKLEYKEKNFILEGVTDKFDGKLEYLYKDESLDLNLEGLSLVKIVQQFKYPSLLMAKVYGNVNYDLANKIILINTKLKETQFRETKMTNMISSATGINMLTDVYDDSSFVAGYQNKRLTSILKIDNGVNHLYLNDTVLNSETNSIDSKFEIKMQNEELFGEIYGTLENPSVSIDVKRLIKYQVEKKLGSFFGNSTKKKLKDELNQLRGFLK